MTQAAVLAALVLVPVTAVAVVARQPRDERRALALMVLVAVGVRVVCALVLHASGAWHLTGRGAITPDEATVDLAARLLERGDDRSPLVLGGSLHTSWLLMSWAVYELWNDLLAMKLVSAVLGALVVVPSYLLARELHSLAAARVAGWAAVVFPPSLVWSALALRETLLALVLTTLVVLAVSATGRGTGALRWVAGTAACLVLLAFTRSYMVPLMAVVVIGAAVLRRPARAALGRSALAAGATVVAAAGLLTLPTGELLVRTTVALVVEPAGNVYNPFSDCEDETACEAVVDPQAAGAQASQLPGAALGTGRGSRAAARTGSGDDLTSSLQSVEQKGVVRALAIAGLAGRPVWRTAEFFFLLQPGVVVWWTILPLAALGAVELARRRRWDGLVATVGYSAAVVVFLAYTGQFIRHHFMMEPVGVALAAMGACALQGAGGPAVGRRWRVATLTATGLAAAAAVVSVALSVIRGTA